LHQLLDELHMLWLFVLYFGGNMPV